MPSNAPDGLAGRQSLAVRGGSDPTEPLVELSERRLHGWRTGGPPRPVRRRSRTPAPAAPNRVSGPVSGSSAAELDTVGIRVFEARRATRPASDTRKLTKAKREGQEPSPIGISLPFSLPILWRSVRTPAASRRGESRLRHITACATEWRNREELRDIMAGLLEDKVGQKDAIPETIACARCDADSPLSLARTPTWLSCKYLRQW